MRLSRRLFPLILLGLIGPSVVARGQSPTPAIAPTPWPLHDALWRSVSLDGKIPSPRADRYVGMFYFLWHNNRGGVSPSGGPYDIAKIVRRDPNALHHPDSPLWGGQGVFHYWGEPLYGYYLGDDPWVIRRHARLLTDAGIDTLIFDATNAATYPEVYTKIGEVFSAIRKAGGRTPAFAFMLNSAAKATADTLLRELYEPGRFRDLWFVWDGKPLLLCDPAEASPAVREFFTLRRAHWPFKMVDTENAWHWEATFPQPFGYTTDPKRPEQVNVSVAQNLRVSDGKVTCMSDGNARGRSFRAGDPVGSPNAVLHGYNFAEQWTRARQLDPPFVLVTGWNEWIAGRFQRKGQPIVFVDQYDQEFSRDIEPMRGGHNDNYYAQLVGEVRRHKGMPPIPVPSPPKSIKLEDGPEVWTDVAPSFEDDPEDAQARDHDGAGGTHHTNRTGRHDLTLMKVARDADRLVFLARFREPLGSAAMPVGTVLLLDTDEDPETGWEGFDYVVQARALDGETWLERYAGQGQWSWNRVFPVRTRVQGRDLLVEVPRKAVGLTNDRPAQFDFQWTDNVAEPASILDFYTQGDVAPEGRFRFRYHPAD